jgi:hypothetical protein
MAERDRADRIEGLLRTQLANRVAIKEIPDDVIRSVAAQLDRIDERSRIRWLDVCAYGICIDHFFDPAEFPEVIKGVFQLDHPVRTITGFPWGIIDPDLIQLTVEHQFDELAQFTGGAHQH